MNKPSTHYTLIPLLLLGLMSAPTGRAEPLAEEKTTEPPPPGETSTPPTSAIDERMREEAHAQDNPFAITTYKPNYILPVSYNFNTDAGETAFDPLEIKFQISFRARLLKDLFKTGGDLMFGYTQQSYWQAYNKDVSSPFRETNYEPEIMLAFRRRQDTLGLKNRLIILGFAHQSNGRSQPLSRSWNRLYVNFIFERENLYFSIKPWYRIPESEKDDPSDPAGDDNPDIEDFMGYGELTALYIKNKHRFGIMLRNNLRRDNKGAVQLDWSRPISRKTQVYVQYFNGYGESLIDYNRSVNRIGVGVMLTNWL